MSNQKSVTPVLLIHGGAGSLRRKDFTEALMQEHLQVLQQSLAKGWQALSANASAAEVVAKAIEVMEDSPLFNAGKGATFNAAGDIELDAAMMVGQSGLAGSVSGVQRTKNPIRLAKQLLEEPVVWLSHQAADQFAQQQGLTMVETEYFKTEKRWQQLERMKQLGSDKMLLSEIDEDEFAWDDDKYGTVGAVALDSQGQLAAGTSTGGLTNKWDGRVGDTPVIGAGTYADERCAISCTGQGEQFIRSVFSHNIASRIRWQGCSLAQAGQGAFQDLERFQGEGGCIGVSHQGEVYMSYNCGGMFRGIVSVDGFGQVGIFDELYAISL